MDVEGPKIETTFRATGKFNGTGITETTTHWSDAEYAAFTQSDEIVNLIQTKEGLGFYTSECGYTTEFNPYKVLNCYEKNMDRIK